MKKKITVNRILLDGFLESVALGQTPTDAELKESAKFIELDLAARARAGRKPSPTATPGSLRVRQSRANNKPSVITFTVETKKGERKRGRKTETGTN